MKKPLLIFFFVSLVLSSVGYAERYGVSESSGENGGFIIVEFKEKEFDFQDLLNPQAIIPPYVNAGSTISFQAEMRKVEGFTGFGGRLPTHLKIEIFKFDSTKPNFIGVFANKYIVSIPQGAISDISNPVNTIVMFDATMSAPKTIGKYRYKATALYQSEITPITQIEQDFDTFNVQTGVPEICPLPTIKTEIQDIEGGKLKLIIQTEYSGSDCTKSEKRTYNAICNEGYKETGSGSSTKCEKIITPPTDPPDEKQVCKTIEVCCEISLFVGDERLKDNPDGKINQCTIPSECGFFAKYPQSKAVAVSNCDGSSPPNPTQICGDKTIQSPETCDDGNIKNNDGCSDTCILEGEEPTIDGEKSSLTISQLKQATKTKIKNSACRTDDDCSKRTGFTTSCSGATNVIEIVEEKFDSLFNKIFGTGIEGICIAEPKDGEGFGDLTNFGKQLADFYKIESVGLAWAITIVIIIIGMAILKKILG